jgi:hypothetical protein
MQTVLNYRDRAENHRISGIGYGILRRRLEEFMAFHSEDSASVEQFTQQFRADWDELAKKVPAIPKHLWHRIEKGDKTT